MACIHHAVQCKTWKTILGSLTNCQNGHLNTIILFFFYFDTSDEGLTNVSFWICRVNVHVSHIVCLCWMYLLEHGLVSKNTTIFGESLNIWLSFLHSPSIDRLELIKQINGCRTNPCCYTLSKSKVSKKSYNHKIIILITFYDVKDNKQRFNKINNNMH